MSRMRPPGREFEIAPWARPRLHFAAILDEAGGPPVDLVTGRELVREDGPVWGTSHLGGGVDWTNSTGNAAWTLAREIPTDAWTMETLLVTPASVPSNAGLIGYAGVSNIHETDRQLYVRGGVAGSYVYTGYTISAEGGAVSSANTAYHLACTNDAAYQTTYLDGAKKDQKAVTNYGYTGYSQPEIRLGYFVVNGSTYATGTGTMLLALIWNGALSADEIAARSAAPFAILARRTLPLLTGSASVASGTTFNETSAGSVSATDASDAAATCACAASQSATVGDSSSVAASAAPSVSQAASASDSAAAGLVIAVAAGDPATAGDGAAVVATIATGVTQSATAGDISAATAGFVASSSGSVAAGDDASLDGAASGTVSDSATAGDTTGAAAAIAAEVTQPASVGDTPAAALIVASAVSQTVAASDPLNVVATFVAGTADAATAADQASTGATVADACGATDGLAADLRVFAASSGSVVASDQAAGGSAFSDVVSASSSAADAAAGDIASIPPGLMPNVIRLEPRARREVRPTSARLIALAARKRAA